MTTMIAELYDALIAAGSPEDKARRAAEAMAGYEAYEGRIIRIETDIAELKRDVSELKRDVAELKRDNFFNEMDDRVCAGVSGRDVFQTVPAVILSKTRLTNGGPR